MSRRRVLAAGLAASVAVGSRARGAIVGAECSDVVFCLLHGSAHGPMGWRWFAQALRRLGHATLAPRLPFEDGDLTAERGAAIVGDHLARIGTGKRIVVAGHSISGLILPHVAALANVDRLVYVAAAVAEPGVSFRQQFQANPAMYHRAWIDEGERSQREPDIARKFLFHDCKASVREQVGADRIRFAATKLWTEPCSLARHPSTPATYILPARDRVFTAGWMRRASRELLGTTPLEIMTGHCPHLASPGETARLLTERPA